MFAEIFLHLGDASKFAAGALAGLFCGDALGFILRGEHVQMEVRLFSDATVGVGLAEEAEGTLEPFAEHMG
ncbi:hypothetical protein F183_A04180 [Bryobacterales bacterium F-183]|nr:hypothetical protein F183_A04180 [Bryobacterales bacterium F-183]